MGKRIGIVCGSFHRDEVERMLAFATDEAEQHGLTVGDVVWVPGSMEVPLALDRLLGHQNAWLAAHNRRPGPQGEPREALTTLTAVALRGRRYAIAHVGDSRAWLLRDGDCLLLTQDHRLERRDFAGLTRALGLDDALRLDHSQGELRVGDRLLLTSDGVHGALRSRQIADLLRAKPENEQILLTLLANKIGDTDKRVGSRAVHLMQTLVFEHSAMKAVVAHEVENVAFRSSVRFERKITA